MQRYELANFVQLYADQRIVRLIFFAAGERRRTYLTANFAAALPYIVNSSIETRAAGIQMLDIQQCSDGVFLIQMDDGAVCSLGRCGPAQDPMTKLLSMLLANGDQLRNLFESRFEEAGLVLSAPRF